MNKRVDYRKCNSEADILKVFASRFLEISDFSVFYDKLMPSNSGLRKFDIVVCYYNQPVAIGEIKKQKKPDQEIKADLKRQLDYYRSGNNVMFYFSIIGNNLYSYNPEEDELIDKSEKEVFEMLIDTVHKQSEVCDELVENICNSIKKDDKSKHYQEKLINYIKKGSLRKIGNTIFLDEKLEKELMHELLWMKVDRTEKRFCRYTSATSFCLSLKNCFRFNDVEVMNDELETKVIDEYPNLNLARHDLTNYVYNGFIMCFSKMSRFDKLFNWYMYGDRAKGVCFAIKAKEQMGDGYFFAPVTYISKNDKGINLLSFLNDLMDLKIDEKYKFVLRFWHYWKFFFKYDYYKEEDEVRLLIMQKEEGETEWSEELNMPYHFISKKLDELPFRITDVVLGPKRGNPDNLKSYIKEDTNISCTIIESEIKGYR